MGAGTDSGHGDANSGSGDNWGVINGGGAQPRQGHRLGRRPRQPRAGRLAKQLAQTYYGSAPQRTYWSGFSGGGHMGWAQTLNFPEEYDGALIGAPAHHWQKFRLADSWDEVVRKKVAQQTTAITAVQMNAANAAAVAACDALDGAVDAFLADPRQCTWSAAAHICGTAMAPAAPACLDPVQAAGIDRIWDGPRNRHGRRIWHAYDRGINLGVSTATQGSTAQVLRWAQFDTSVDGSKLYEDQASINLAALAGVDVSGALTYEAAALQVSLNSADFTDVDEPQKLELARQRGIKLIVYHGTADPLIHMRNDIDFYTRVATHFGWGMPDYTALSSWYRFFMVPAWAIPRRPFCRRSSTGWKTARRPTACFGPAASRWCAPFRSRRSTWARWAAASATPTTLSAAAMCRHRRPCAWACAHRTSKKRPTGSRPMAASALPAARLQRCRHATATSR